MRQFIAVVLIFIVSSLTTAKAQSTAIQPYAQDSTSAEGAGIRAVAAVALKGRPNVALSAQAPIPGNQAPAQKHTHPVRNVLIIVAAVMGMAVVIALLSK